MKQPPPFHRRARTQGASMEAANADAFLQDVPPNLPARFLAAFPRGLAVGFFRKTRAEPRRQDPCQTNPSHRFRAYEKAAPRKGPPRHRRRSRKDIVCSSVYFIGSNESPPASMASSKYSTTGCGPTSFRSSLPICQHCVFGMPSISSATNTGSLPALRWRV